MVVSFRKSHGAFDRRIRSQMLAASHTASAQGRVEKIVVYRRHSGFAPLMDVYRPARVAAREKDTPRSANSPCFRNVQRNGAELFDLAAEGPSSFAAHRKLL